MTIPLGKVICLWDGCYMNKKLFYKVYRGKQCPSMYIKGDIMKYVTALIASDYTFICVRLVCALSVRLANCIRTGSNYKINENVYTQIHKETNSRV